jgi:hypothetical protein
MIAELDEVVFLCRLCDLCETNNPIESLFLCEQWFYTTKYSNRTCASIYYAPITKGNQIVSK